MLIDMLDRSREYIQDGQFEKAQVILRRFLNDNPNSPKALELSGDLASRMGKNEEAIAFYERAVDSYTQNNQIKEAIISFEKILRFDKKNIDRFFRLANVYREFGLPNEGLRKILALCSWAMENKEEDAFISGLKKIVELQAKNLRLRLSFVKILMSFNRTAEADSELNSLKNMANEVNDTEILDEINKLLPQTDGGEDELDPKSRIELGNLLYEIGSKDEALIEFNKAVNDLIETGEINEAIDVLNRMIEIDPNNEAAINKLNELKGEPKERKERVAEIPEEIDQTAEMGVEKDVETREPSAERKVGLDIFDDLIRDVEEYVAPVEKHEEPAKPAKETEEITSLEGQIADIEFLLKEIEAGPAPSFEVAKEFDDFRSNIKWEAEDTKKKLAMAKMAFDAELYETTLNYVTDIKDDKQSWPTSLELTGASLVRLGQYSEAIKTIGPAILIEDISETAKIEIRYVLASAYQGLGDFGNALREIKHIMSVNPDYKDVRELYELLGGKEIFEAPAKEVEKITEETIKTIEQVETPKETGYESPYPTIIEETPEKEEGMPPETPPEEKRGENISFL